MRGASVPAQCENEPDIETRLVADVSGLVSPPIVCVKLFELVQSGRASAAEIGEVVSCDPNLSARLLRIVNSSFYGLSTRVETVARAVTVLGLSDLHNLALAISAVRSFSAMKCNLVSMDAFWHHSIFCALVARHLARRHGLRDADRVFVAGLLHDVGITVIYSQLEDVARLEAAAVDGESALAAAEREQLGFDHASLGARLLESWQLPSTLVEAIRHHHDVGSAGSASVEAALLQLADGIAAASESGRLLDAPAPPMDEAACAALGMSPDSVDVDEVVEAVSVELGEVTRSLMPR